MSRKNRWIKTNAEQFIAFSTPGEDIVRERRLNKERYLLKKAEELQEQYRTHKCQEEKDAMHHYLMQWDFMKRFSDQFRAVCFDCSTQWRINPMSKTCQYLLQSGQLAFILSPDSCPNCSGNPTASYSEVMAASAQRWIS